MKKLIAGLLLLVCVISAQGQTIFSRNKVNADSLSVKYFITLNGDTIRFDDLPMNGQFIRRINGIWQNSEFALDSIQNLDFYILNAFTKKQGRLTYDPDLDALTFQPRDTAVIGSLLEELWTPLCYNATGDTIRDGSPVYVEGAYSGHPTINIASNKTFDKSRTVGVATQDIAPGKYGRVTRFGYVNKTSLAGFTAGTDVYLGDSILTDDRPQGGDYPVVIGKTIIGGEQGRLLVYPQEALYTAEVNNPSGWSSYLQGEQATLAFNNGTRVLSITPTAGSFYYYHDGAKFIKAGTQSITITAAEGLHVVYYEKDVLKELVNPSVDIIYDNLRNNIPVTFIYWDATNSKALYVSNSRHTFRWPRSVQAFMHSFFGTLYKSGLSMTNMVTSGAGDVNTHAQFGVGSGSVVDEDIPTETPTIASTTGLPIYYRLGTNWRNTLRSGYSFLNGTTYAQYNLNTAGSWSLSECASGEFTLLHVFATNSIYDTYKVVAFMGTHKYVSAADAEGGAGSELTSLLRSGLPFTHYKLIATLILETKSTFTNSTHSRFVPIPSTTSDFMDWRTTSLYSSSSSSGGSGGGTATTFISLLDAPSSYALQASKLVGVNSAQTAVEFKPVTVDGSGNVAGVNNITATGTIDGRDVSVDGTNLTNHLASDNDMSATNEFNTSMGWDAPSKTVSVTDAGATRSVVLTGLLTTEVDGSVTNEIQTLATSGAAGNVSISGGNSININVDDADASPTNEIQYLSGSGSALGGYSITLSGGLPVTLPSESDPVFTASSWYTTTNNSVNWNKYNQWDGGSTGLVPATGRTSLGATTIGASMFTLTNPSAITFPRFNADNTVSALSAADFRTALGLTNLWTADTYGLAYAGGNVGVGASSLSDTKLYTYSTLAGGKTAWFYNSSATGNGVLINAGSTSSQYGLLINNYLNSGELFRVASNGDLFAPTLQTGITSNVVYFDTTTGKFTYGTFSGGSSQWLASTYGIYYSSGNVGMGLSAVNGTRLAAEQSVSVNYTGRIRNTSPTGFGLFVETAATGSNPVVNFQTTALNDLFRVDADGSVKVSALANSTEAYVVGYNATTKKLSYFTTPAGGGSIPGAGIALSNGTTWGTSITNNSANWNTAYSWGNHAGLYVQNQNSSAQTANMWVSGTVHANGGFLLNGQNLFNSLSNGFIPSWNGVKFINAYLPTVQTLSGTTVTWNVNLGINAAITLSGNTTITLSNLVAGTSGNLRVTNNVALYTLTFAGYTNKISPAVYAAANRVTTSGSSKIDVYSWYYDGTYLIWNGGNDYK